LRLGGHRLDLLAKMQHVRVDDAVGDGGVLPPGGVDDLLAAQHAPTRRPFAAQPSARAAASPGPETLIPLIYTGASDGPFTSGRSSYAAQFAVRVPRLARCPRPQVWDLSSWP